MGPTMLILWNTFCMVMNSRTGRPNYLGIQSEAAGE